MGALTMAAGLVGSGAVRANEPMIVISVHEMKFQAQAQGTTSAPQEIVLSNIGNADLVIASIVIAGENSGEFLEADNCPTSPAVLAPNAVCAIQVVFKPKIAGDLAATLSVSDNGSGSPQSVLLSGHSGAPKAALVLSPTTLAFGSQHIGGPSKLLVIVLKNNGSAQLNISSAIRVTGPASSEFHLESVREGCPETSGELAPNASCSVGVVFTPVSMGPKSAQLVVDDDAEGSPHTVALSGAGS